MPRWFKIIYAPRVLCIHFKSKGPSNFKKKFGRQPSYLQDGHHAPIYLADALSPDCFLRLFSNFAQSLRSLRGGSLLILGQIEKNNMATRRSFVKCDLNDAMLYTRALTQQVSKVFPLFVLDGFWKIWGPSYHFIPWLLRATSIYCRFLQENFNNPFHNVLMYYNFFKHACVFAHYLCMCYIHMNSFAHDIFIGCSHRRCP